MSLRAGLLTESITIRRATITKNNYGEEVESWEDIYTTRARVTNQSSTKQDENSETLMYYSKEFFVRYYVPVKEFDVILWEDKKYRIISIDKDRHNQYQTIIGELINE